MAKIKRHPFSGSGDGKRSQWFPTGLDAVSGHGIQAVPLFFFGHTFNPRTASGRCGLRRNGSVE